MKVLCLISRGPGHLDFGGSGYLRLLKALIKKGHDVVVLSTKHNCNRVAEENIPIITVAMIDKLWLLREDFDYSSLKNQYFIPNKQIELKIKQVKPDVVLVDSLLGLAGNMCLSLDIPFISVGVPGGNWKKVKKSIVQGTSLHNANETRSIIEKKLKWNKGELSAFCNSPYYNIVFLGKEYYGLENSNTLYVNLFSDVKPKKENRIGISLGSGTIDYELMKKAIIKLCNTHPETTQIELYARTDNSDKLLELLPETAKNRLNIMGYVEFKKVLPGLSKLVYAGGVGTTWYCLEYGIQPVVLSAGIHDQDFNLQRIESLVNNTVGIESIEKHIDYKPNLFDKTKMTHNISIESLIKKIESLAN